MALSNAVISYDLADLTGVDFDIRRTKVWVSTNIADGTVIDTVGNAIRVDTGRGSLAADGTGSVTVWTPGTGSNPDSWQTYVHLDYASPMDRTRKRRTFGPFTVTTSANLADLVEEQEVPAEYLTAVTAALDAYVDDAEAAAAAAEAAQAAAEAAADLAVDVSGIATPDGVVEALIEDTGSDTYAALSAAYARVPGEDVATRHPLTGWYHVESFGALCDGTTNDTTAVEAAIAAVNVSAASAGIVYFPPGTTVISKSSRLTALTRAASGFMGSPDGASVVRFTHASGGFDIGNGTDYVYTTRIRDLIIDGNSVCATPLRVRKGEELMLENVLIQAGTTSLADFTDTSQLDCPRLRLSTCAGDGFRFFGTIGKVTIRDANLYSVSVPFKVSATAFGPFNYDTGWSETCADLMVFDTGGSVVVSRISIRESHFVHAGGTARIFRVAGGLVSGDTGLLNLHDCTVYWPSVTTPMFDFSAIDNSAAVLRTRLRDLIVYAPSLGSEHLIRPHASQAWNNFYVDAGEIQGLDVDRWHIGNNTAGGVRYKSQEISDYAADPNSVMKGFIGWQFTSEVDGSFWKKTSGQGTNTGWVAVS